MQECDDGDTSCQESVLARSRVAGSVQDVRYTHLTRNTQATSAGSAMDPPDSDRLAEHDILSTSITSMLDAVGPGAVRTDPTSGVHVRSLAGPLLPASPPAPAAHRPGSATGSPSAGGGRSARLVKGGAILAAAHQEE
jgi:hypothetical protein